MRHNLDGGEEVLCDPNAIADEVQTVLNWSCALPRRLAGGLRVCAGRVSK